MPLSALWLLLLIFILLLTGPFLVGRFVYETTYNELKAGYDNYLPKVEYYRGRRF